MQDEIELPDSYVLLNCRLIDGISDESRDKMWISVAEGKISRIGSMDALGSESSGRRIDVEGRTVMPGLIDCHVHLVYGGFRNMEDAIRCPVETAVINASLHAWIMLQAGYTAVREVGCIGNTSVAVRDAIRQGKIQGPRVVASGRPIGTTGGPADILPPHWESTGGRLVVDGVEGFRKAIRRQIKEGVDNIKILASGVEVNPTCWTWMTTISQEELSAAVEEAHRWGKTVAIHAQSYDSVKFALRAGADTIEHGTRLDDESIAMLKASPSILVPTLCTLYSVLELGATLNLGQKQREEMATNESLWVESIRSAHRAGVSIAAGGDIGNRYKHGTNARELELLTKIGMTPMEAIHAATSTAARVLRMADQIGSLDEGRFADLLVVDGDPTEDLAILQDKTKLKLVIKEGQVVAGTASPHRGGGGWLTKKA
ncbi:metal-dependent hydrolase family protein [Candidimonas nitroreducens]|nr:amidohydrolase family protein [Candidimonas nitroreducens]